jgi:PAS domain S-box-containing protein
MIRNETGTAPSAFRKIFEACPVGMALTHLDFTFATANETFCNMLGYSEQELKKLTFKDFTHPNDLTHDLISLDLLVTGRITSYKTEKRYIRKDGQVIWGLLNVILIRDDAGTGRNYLVVVEEITYRKTAEEALRVSEEKYRLLFENLNYGFLMGEVITDQTNEPVDFRIVEVNRYVKEFLGFDPVEVRGKTILEIFPTAEMEIDVIKKICSPALTGIPVAVESYSTTLKKHLKIHSYCPVKGYFAAIYEDVSERWKAEAEVREKNDELRRLNVEKDKFFSIIAHDLKSPFHTFINLTRMMEEKFPSFTLVKNLEYIRMIGDSAVNLFRLLENLLDWAKLQRGMISVNPVSISVLSAVESNLDMVRDHARKKNIDVSTDVPEDMQVYADERMVDGILRNLITNAVKFTQPGGKIAVAAKHQDRTHIVISVRDTGIGISRKMCDNLFRLDVSSGRPGTEGEVSTGLGLILCKEFVERNGGTISVKSKPGKGSVFSFTLPA